MIENTKTQIDIAALAERIVERFPLLTERGRRVALTAYRTLAIGLPVSDYSIAAVAGHDISEVSEEMADWPGVYRSDSGRIIGFWGLALEETPHEFEVEGRTLYTWCAWDTLFLPDLLGKEALVLSRSGASGAEVSLRVTPSGAIPTDGHDIVVSFVDPARSDAEGNRMISTFSHHILFFSTRQEGERWASEQGEGAFILSLDEAFELGRRTNRLMYGEALTE